MKKKRRGRTAAEVGCFEAGVCVPPVQNRRRNTERKRRRRISGKFIKLFVNIYLRSNDETRRCDLALEMADVEEE